MLNPRCTSVILLLLAAPGPLCAVARAPAAVAMRACSSRCRVIICTIPAGKGANTDTVASALLMNLIRDLSAKAFPVAGNYSLY